IRRCAEDTLRRAHHALWIVHQTIGVQLVLSPGIFEIRSGILLFPLLHQLERLCAIVALDRLCDCRAQVVLCTVFPLRLRLCPSPRYGDCCDGKTKNCLPNKSSHSVPPQKAVLCESPSEAIHSIYSISE